MDATVAFIINPFSAKKQSMAFLEMLKAEIPDVTYYISESPEGTAEFIKTHLPQVKTFVAVGGDGTISSVAAHLIHTDAALAIFPAGSGNGFSNETHFKKNLHDLLEKIKRREVKYIDTFLVNEYFSINVSGAGFDGKVAKEFEKTSRGFGNYIQLSLKTFFGYKPIKVKFKTPELKSYNGKYLMINIANTRQFGNNAYIAPMASKSDGLVDIALVKKFPLWHGALFGLRLFTKKLDRDKYVTYLSVAEAELKLSTKNWHIDGDYKKIKSPVKIKVLPKSLKILI